MKKMKIVKTKNTIAALALSFLALLLMPGIFANQALAQATPVITSANMKSCVADQACSYQITATKTNSPTSYGATELPTGLTVNIGTGLISGIPRTAGTFPVTVCPPLTHPAAAAWRSRSRLPRHWPGGGRGSKRGPLHHHHRRTGRH